MQTSVPTSIPPTSLSRRRVRHVVGRGMRKPSGINLRPSAKRPVFLHVNPCNPCIRLNRTDSSGPGPGHTSLPGNVGTRSVALRSTINLLQLPHLLNRRPRANGPVGTDRNHFNPCIIRSRNGSNGSCHSVGNSSSILAVSLRQTLRLLTRPGTKQKHNGTAPLGRLNGRPSSNRRVTIFGNPCNRCIGRNGIGTSIPRKIRLRDVALRRTLR